jgi:RHS repeat-associated protein
VDATYNRSFTYDDLHRLTGANTGSALWGNGAYTYDNLGNMLSLTLGSARNASFSYVSTTPKLSAVTENAVNRTVTYDAAGNETTVGAANYNYSPRNLLATGDDLTYSYDGRGVRVITTLPTTTTIAASLSLAPGAVLSTATSTATVTLSAPAPGSGARIALSSQNDAAAQVPLSITIPSGSTTGTFTITTAPVSTTTNVLISAAYNGVTASASLTINPPLALNGVSLNPTLVTGPYSATGTVTLNTNAPAGGATVTLSSDNATAASVPSSVTVPEGASSANFAVTTSSVTTATSVTISGTLTQTRTATLVVGAPGDSTRDLTYTTFAQPCRIIDTRIAGGALTASRSFHVAGTTGFEAQGGTAGGCAIPLGPAKTVMINFVAVAASGAGNLRGAAWPNAVPTTSSIINYQLLTPALNVANGVIFPICDAASSACSTGYDITIQPSASVHLVADVLGYYALPGATSPIVPETQRDLLHATFQQPCRIIDTQLAGGVLTAAAPRSFKVTGTLGFESQGGAPGGCGVPEGATVAMVNFVAVNPQGAGNLQGAAFPYNIPVTGSILNYQLLAPNLNIANGILFPLCDPTLATCTSDITLQANLSGTHLQADVIGYFSSGASQVTHSVPASQRDLTYTTFQQPCRIIDTRIAGGALSPEVLRDFRVAGTSGFELQGGTTNGCGVPETAAAAMINFVAVAAQGGGNLRGAAFPNLATGTLVQYQLLSPTLNLANGLLFPICDRSATTCNADITLTASGAGVHVVADVMGYAVVGEGSSQGVAEEARGEQILLEEPDSQVAAASAARPASRGVRMGLRKFLHRLFRRSRPVSTSAVPIRDVPLALAVSADLVADQIGAMSAGTKRRYSFYTPELNLMAESQITDASTPAIAYEYVWFNGRPIAQIDVATSTTSWTFTDHLGTPLSQTDSGASVTWRAEQEPFGRLFALRTPDRHQPLRLPGQEAEQADLLPNGQTERSYNIHRWYRSRFGRYTQSDPIGLRRDINLYRYAINNPARYMDPWGLECTCPDCPSGFWFQYGGTVTLMSGWVGAQGSLYRFRCPSGRVFCDYVIGCGKLGVGGFVGLSGGAGISLFAHCSSELKGFSFNIFDHDLGNPEGPGLTLSGSVNVGTAGTVGAGGEIGFGGGMATAFNICHAWKLSCGRY